MVDYSQLRDTLYMSFLTALSAIYSGVRVGFNNNTYSLNLYLAAIGGAASFKSILLKSRLILKNVIAEYIAISEKREKEWISDNIL